MRRTVAKKSFPQIGFGTSHKFRFTVSQKLSQHKNSGTLPEMLILLLEMSSCKHCTKRSKNNPFIGEKKEGYSYYDHQIYIYISFPNVKYCFAYIYLLYIYIYIYIYAKQYFHIGERYICNSSFVSDKKRGGVIDRVAPGNIHIYIYIYIYIYLKRYMRRQPIEEAIEGANTKKY